MKTVNSKIKFLMESKQIYFSILDEKNPHIVVKTTI